MTDVDIDELANMNRRDLGKFLAEHTREESDQMWSEIAQSPVRQRCFAVMRQEKAVQKLRAQRDASEVDKLEAEALKTGDELDKIRFLRARANLREKNAKREVWRVQFEARMDQLDSGSRDHVNAAIRAHRAQTLADGYAPAEHDLALWEHLPEAVVS